MQNQVKERWLELCEQAANEQNAEKLLVLVQEINRLLERADEDAHAEPAALGARRLRA